MITIVLVEPENSGNLGAVARAMKNFDFNELVLIKPKVNHLSKKALKRAKHAQDILRKAKVKEFSYLKHFDCLVGTTSKLGTDYNIPRSPLNPEQLADKLVNYRGKIGLLIGREGIGLTNKEIAMCDFVVTIPASKKYPALNISHASAIVLYEIFKKSKKEKTNEHILFATKKEKDVILKMVDKALDKIEFSTKEKKQTQKTVWKRLIGKAFLTKREAFAVMGFFRKLR